MLKPTSTYRMSTASKYQLAKISDPHLRGAIKRSIIDADLTAAIQPKRDKKPNARPGVPE